MINVGKFSVRTAILQLRYKMTELGKENANLEKNKKKFFRKTNNLLPGLKLIIFFAQHILQFHFRSFSINKKDKTYCNQFAKPNLNPGFGLRYF